MKEKQRFSLRKTAAGVASALLGTSLMLTSMAPVLAAEETGAEAVAVAAETDEVKVAEANLAQAQKNYEAVLKEFEKWVVYLDEFEEKDVKEAEKAKRVADKQVVDTLAALTEAKNVADKAREKHVLAYAARSEAYKALKANHPEAAALVDAQAALEKARADFDSPAQQKVRAEARTEILRLETADNIRGGNLGERIGMVSAAEAEVEAKVDALAAAVKLEPGYASYTKADVEQMVEDLKAGNSTALDGLNIPEVEDLKTAVTDLTTAEGHLNQLKGQIATEQAKLVFDGNGALAKAVKDAQADLDAAATKDAQQKAYNEFVAKDFVKEYNLAKAEKEQAEAAEKLAGEAHNAAKAAQLDAAKALTDARLNQFEVLKKLRTEIGIHNVTALGHEIERQVNVLKGKLDVAEKRLELAKGALRKAQGLVDGFAKEDGEWFYYENGVKKTGWHKASYGTWYYFDEKGGAMVTGWRQVNGSWYYFENWGGMATGWKSLGGSWYYLNPSGAMATGWKKVGQNWYYLNQSGAMATGWKKVGKNWYFLLPSGAMRTEAVKIGGRVYRFAPSGALL